MTQNLQPVEPQRNATVMASAGTGKTWLLVTRIVRLLLAGARPDGILAITFTRKAAGEMLARLNDRLLDFVHSDDTGLDASLTEIGLTPDAELRRRARGLYEQLLFSPRPLRTTTFHALCQEILQRFPLEADVPPGFDLLDTVGSLQQEAWDALYQEATLNPDNPLAQALEYLFDHCGGLHNTQQALENMLQMRSDWWAYTAGADDAPAHALERLTELLEIDPDGPDPVGGFFSPTHREQLAEFARLLARHVTKGNAAHANLIARILEAPEPGTDHYTLVRGVFLTQKNEPRKREANKALRKSLGDADAERLVALHEHFCRLLDDTDDHLARLRTRALSGAWFVAGARLLDHFQRIKLSQRLLDFTDLEWKTYRLLSHSDNAHWVQYKLDQRIDHFLVDEFQDTNPTQWRLLLPLLEELAAGGSERARSVFLVGDDKQSIYGFRRADPRLLAGASHWLQEHLGGSEYTLAKSWRSSPAVIQCVNAVFTQPALAGRLTDFRSHDTHRQSLWGRVEVLPLVERQESDEEVIPDAGLRNPLHTPRVVDEDRRYQEEGRLIAERIRALVDGETTVDSGQGARAIDYGDIFILLRKRTHAEAIERALREAAIPYLGAERGTLLASLEISDMEALLTTLIAPYDNLALAQVLRSPLFTATDQDLVALAGAGTGPWHERLAQLAPTQADDAPLARAQRLLSRWQELTGAIPVHDLLDRIYSEGDVLARYASAFPGPLKPRVRANLTRFIELALELDGGRYPSLPRFLERLRELKRHALEAPDAPPAVTGEARVRIMTIHASKGLEAPVVFLADSTADATHGSAWQAVVDWPTDAERPRSFLLAGKRSELDRVSRAVLDRQTELQSREDANLLYVALTRARQYLIVSAARPTRSKSLGWYGDIRSALESIAEDRNGTFSLDCGQALPITEAPAAPPALLAAVDPRLARRVPVPPPRREIAPSRSGDALDPHGAPEADGRLRGIAIHRMLELLSQTTPPALETVPAQVAQELGMAVSDPRLTAWLTEAQAVIEAPQLTELFRPETYQRAFTEVPIHYEDTGRLVHGVIDRLIVRAEEVLVVDYKTHAHAHPANLNAIADNYRDQMRWYAEGVRRLWPRHTLRAALLFTACQSLYPMELE